MKMNNSHDTQTRLTAFFQDYTQVSRYQKVALPGVGIKTGALIVVVADTPAANQIGGFKEGGQFRVP